MLKSQGIHQVPKVTNGINQTFQHLLQPRYTIRIFLTSLNKPNCIVVNLYKFFFPLLKSIKGIQLLELILTTRKNCDKHSYNKTNNNNNQNLSPKNLRSAIQQTPQQVKHRTLIRIINNSLARQIPIYEIINPHQIKHIISIRTSNNSLAKHIPIYQIITPN